jgi:protein TonB
MKAIKIALVFILVLNMPSILIGQNKEFKKIYIDKSYSQVDSSEASFYKMVDYLDSDSLNTKVYIHYLSGEMYSTTEYSNYPKFIKNGLSQKLYKDGNIKSEIEYQNNKYHGKLKTYYNNGQLKREEKYQDGKLLESHCFGLTGKDTTNYPYEVSARYPGGENALMQYISANIKYPNKARRKGIEGAVYIKFIVNSIGEIEEIKLIKSVDPLLDNEALRVVGEMGKWIPAEMDGEKTSMSFTLPIKFKLE